MAALQQLGITHFLLGSVTALLFISDVKDCSLIILIMSDGVVQYHRNHCHGTILQKTCQ